jgi:hypothetical protein
MFGDYLFDDRGETWCTQSSDWCAHLGIGNTFHSLSDYAIKNLGFVRVQSQPRRVVISMRPSVVAGPTLTGLFYYLADCRFRSIALRQFDDISNSWHYAVLSAHESPINQIVTLVENTSAIAVRSSFLSRRVSFATITDKSPLQDSIGYYRDTGGRLKVGQIPNFSTIFARRHMLYKVDEQNARVTLVSIGGSFPKSIQEFLFRAVGTDVRDRPDAMYGAECSKAYLTVARTGEPGCFEVDAISKWQDGDDFHRRRYRRVIFPFRDDYGHQWVLGQSSVDDAIDLRALAS